MNLLQKINSYVTKTPLMTNLVLSEEVYKDGIQVEETTSYKYLGHEIRDNQTYELFRRVRLI